MQNFFDSVKPNLATIAAESEIVSGTTRRLLADGYYNVASYRGTIEPSWKRALAAYMEIRKQVALIILSRSKSLSPKKHLGSELLPRC